MALEDAGVGEGALLPHEILIEGDTDPGQVASAVAGVEGIHGAVAPDSPHWRRDGTAIVEAIPIPDSGSGEGEATLQGVRQAAHDTGPDVRVGGQPAGNADFIDAVYGSFPLMIALITITTFILLARAFRSLLLPAKAIVLNILSVAAAWGVLVLVWQHGYGSELIWGIEATGSIPSWMPLMIFAFLFGLSMDYEVFILSRMREEYDRTGSTEQAVITGIGRTGRLVTSAALILFLTFVAMGSSPGTDLKMFATGLGAGILLDATIIRALIVPAVMSLMGSGTGGCPSSRRGSCAWSRRAPPAGCDRGERGLERLSPRMAPIRVRRASARLVTAKYGSPALAAHGTSTSKSSSRISSRLSR